MSVLRERVKLPMLNSRNQYQVYEGGVWLDLADQFDTSLGFGRDYYADILRTIETNGKLAGLTFYLTKEAPDSLPSYGSSVVLIIVGDEHYGCFPYFLDILAVLRCYGNWPSYFDGFPTDLLKLSAMLLFALKFCEHLRDLWRATKFRRSLVRRLHRRTLHVPLGSFGVFEPRTVGISSRSIDYAFLGSIDYRQHPWYSPRSFIKPPKFAARIKMIKALEHTAKASRHWKGMLDVSSGFHDSISKEENYALVMSDCKISICPRGSNHETYRFYESCKSGCVVVGEPLPRAWFYAGNPGIVIKDWRELPGTLDRLLSSNEELERLSKSCRDYWASNLAENVVAEKIEVFLQSLLSD